MNVYLFFNGNCEEALNHYIDATDGVMESIQRYGDSPMPVAEEQKGKIIHAVAVINDTRIMASDNDGKMSLNMGNNIWLALDFKSEAAQDKAFAALSEGGIVTMPLQDTFWNARYGMCTDKFGVNWMFNYDKPAAE